MLISRTCVARLRKLARVLHEPSYRRALRHGVAASVEHERIPLRRDFATVIDVGANRGQFAVFAARQFPNAQLICIEPLEAARRRLSRVIASTGRARIIEFAVGAQSGQAEFHISNADDSSSLLPIGRRQREMFPGTAERATEIVEVRSLDDIVRNRVISRPALLKIDVQGGELAVLQGSAECLASIDVVLVEASFVELYEGQALVDAVWSELSTRGFRCHGVWSLMYSQAGECLQADFLFARDGVEPF